MSGIFVEPNANLQGQREFTPLLIDPASLMDKSTKDYKLLQLGHHWLYTQHKINHTVTHLQLLNDFKQLGVLIERTEQNAAVRKKGKEEHREEEEHDSRKWKLHFSKKKKTTAYKYSY